MSDEPARLIVMKRLTDEIAERADLKGHVFRGRDHYGEDELDQLPMVSICEDFRGSDDFPLQTIDGSATVISLKLLVIGLSSEDLVNPTDPATLLMYRVMNALRGIKRDGLNKNGDRNILGLGKMVDKITIGSGYIAPSWINGMTGIALFQMPVIIDYVETFS